VVLIDPLDYELGDVFKPHFSYAQGRAPLPLEQLASEIASADGYVMVSSEYNHSMSPALMHLLNHFGSSLFAFKPSAIVTYSAGQWGGAGGGGYARFSVRAGLFAGVGHDPYSDSTCCFAADGSFAPEVDSTRWVSYIERTFSQLIWWAEAAGRSGPAREAQGLHQLFCAILLNAMRRKPHRMDYC
jgi:NAD(P)H-dependent FMN reductase